MLNATHYRDDQGRAVISKSKAHAIGMTVAVLLTVGLYNFVTVRLDLLAEAQARESKATEVTATSTTQSANAPIVLRVGIEPAWTNFGRVSDVSAYTSRVQETDDTPCIAANGKDICELYAKGVQSCASNDYKMGTVLHIQGMGECIVMDRMNKHYTGTGRVDWYMGYNLKGALSHGVKRLTVTVVKK